MKKIRSSTKICIGFALITGGGYFAYGKITDAMIMGETFPLITPGKVNFVGVNLGSDFRIIVANDIAQLVETQGGFGAKESSGGGATDGAIKRRIPMKELLETLKGDSKALGEFVMRLNGMQENDNWPPERVYWKKAEIQKAIAGDPVLLKKLEDDLNMKLDGTPYRTLNVKSLEDGIIIVSPVTIQVNINGKVTPVTGEVMEPYKPAMIKKVEASYADNANVNNTIRSGYYATEAQAVFKNPKLRENIKASLESAISEKTAKNRTVAPERILKSATIVVNENFITNASYRSFTTNDGKKLNNLTISLNDEGRKRLWQYSKKRIGDQLLIVADGIAIGAPHIQHALSQGEVTIGPLPDETLVKDMVDKIKANSK